MYCHACGSASARLVWVGSKKVWFTPVRLERVVRRGASRHLGLGIAHFGLSSHFSHLLRVAEPTSWRQQIGSAIPSREAGQKLANSAAWPYILRVNVSVAYAYQKEDRARHFFSAAQATACREPE